MKGFHTTNYGLKTNILCVFLSSVEYSHSERGGCYPPPPHPFDSLLPLPPPPFSPSLWPPLNSTQFKCTKNVLSWQNVPNPSVGNGRLNIGFSLLDRKMYGNLLL